MSRRIASFLFLFWLSAFAAGLRGAEVEIACSPARVTARQGEQVVLQFVVRNRSAVRLEPGGNLFISYHAGDAAGRMTRFEQVRSIEGGHATSVNDPGIYDKYLTVAAITRLGSG